MSDDRERSMRLTYGFSEGEWQGARDRVRRRLQQLARQERTIPYSDLVSELAAAGHIHIEPTHPAVAGILGQVSVLEHEEGRPMVTAVVVHKTGDMAPGPGFCNLARELGHTVPSGKDGELEFWSGELARCFDYWAKA
jgi:hypothetical protein